MKDLLSFFSSVRLSVFLLILLAAGSFVGTLVIRVDVYHSLPFRILIGLFSFNLIFCTIDRLPRVLRRLKDQGRDFEKKFHGKPAAEDEFVVSASEAEAVSFATEILKGVGGRVKRASLEGATILFTRRMVYSELGPYVVHLAVLLILLGSYLGSSLGFKGVMELYEGERSDSAVTQDRERVIPLGFSVECLDFDVEYYESGAPREYTTRLGVLSDDGTVAEDRLIEVNHPWFYRGIGFYQQSWGRGRTYGFTVAGIEDGDTQSMEVSLGESFEIPESGLVLMPVMDFSDGSGEGMGVSEGLFVHVFFQDRMQGHLRMVEGEPVELEGYSISFDRKDEKVWTGLEVVKDPGIPFVWSGFAIFCIGLFMSFLASHQRYWIRVRGEGDQVRLEFFGASRRGEAAVKRKISGMKNELAERIRKG